MSFRALWTFAVLMITLGLMQHSISVLFPKQTTFLVDVWNNSVLLEILMMSRNQLNEPIKIQALFWGP
jgi:hypothetical protein